MQVAQGNSCLPRRRTALAPRPSWTEFSLLLDRAAAWRRKDPPRPRRPWHAGWRGPCAWTFYGFRPTAPPPAIASGPAAFMNMDPGRMGRAPIGQPRSLRLKRAIPRLVRRACSRPGIGPGHKPRPGVAARVHPQGDISATSDRYFSEDIHPALRPRGRRIAPCPTGPSLVSRSSSRSSEHPSPTPLPPNLRTQPAEQ